MRLALAQDGGLLPASLGRTCVSGVFTPERVSGVATDEILCLSSSASQQAQLQNAHLPVARTSDGPCDTSIVCATRSKDETKDLLAQAAARTPNGLIVVDGQKTDGIESLAKALKSMGASLGAFSKAHGKTLWFDAASAHLSDWASPPRQAREEWWTAPGVFSADGPDPASELLAAHLPPAFDGDVLDLGAGWGYLSHHVATRLHPDATLHLVEDNANALDCARKNVAFDGAAFHWADVRQWTVPERVSDVVMNPPFHQARKSDPDLGIAFIERAAAALRPGGTLWMVANSHLPYDDALNTHFSNVTEVHRTKVFRVIRAQKKSGSRQRR